MDVARSENGKCGPRDQVTKIPNLGFQIQASPRSQSEGHRSFHDHLPTDSGVPGEQAHSAPQALHDHFDHDDITRVHGTAKAYTLDAGKKWKLLLILGLGENQDRSDLRDHFRENRRWEHHPPRW